MSAQDDAINRRLRELYGRLSPSQRRALTPTPSGEIRGSNVEPFLQTAATLADAELQRRRVMGFRRRGT